MTIRPVYERPHVLRTLLCLLVGVLALLWRAVPSFPYTPSTCKTGYHSHTMDPGDGFIWLCYEYGPSGRPCDYFRAQYLYGGCWLGMQRYSTYYYSTCMRLRTYGDPAYPSHLNTLCLKFAATINSKMHCHVRTGCYLFECGCENTVDTWSGSALTMYWCNDW